jgi:hypothetical protein
MWCHSVLNAQDLQRGFNVDVPFFCYVAMLHDVSRIKDPTT